MPRKLALLVIVVAIAAGCGAWGHRNAAPNSTRPVELPQAPPERRAAALFYSDLGPDTVDVSAYPAEVKRDYETFARACSRCHTLARAVNAPYVNRGWWEFYTARMRVRAHFHGEALSKQDLRAVLDFLEHDSNARKVADAARFEETKAELKRRFETALDERMEELQRRPAPRLGR